MQTEVLYGQCVFIGKLLNVPCPVCVKDEVQCTAMGLRRGKVKNGTKSQCFPKVKMLQDAE